MTTDVSASLATAPGRDGVRRDVSLDDKYLLRSGRVYISGIQALVRLPMMQRQRDLAAGLNTAGFISGYRGSPLGVYDNALWQARRLLEQEHVVFQPGLNEDLAATAVWGSQQVGLFPGAKYDGVFGIWYGKGPGVDRSMDALKHANSAGTSKYGGVLAIAGDDHGCQSSTLAHQSEQVYMAAMMPVLNPANVQEYLDFGVRGFALSRYSGCWVGFKAISEAVESSASVHVDPDRIRINIPTDFEMPPGGLNIRWPDPPLEAEARLHGPRMEAVAAFARANPFDEIVLDSRDAGVPGRIGLMTTGKAHLDARQALADLGVSDDQARALGLRIYKVGLTWPLEREGALRFAEGLEEILVLEEKRGFIEDQLMRYLYNMPADRRPMVVGKRDENGAPLLPSEGEFNPTMVARVIVSRLRRRGQADPALEQRLARLESFEQAGALPVTSLARTPFFCSGCPHNTSTNVPEGSRAMAGIGCHGMASYIPARRTATITHMGGEGANWIGQAPFTEEPHVFQNLGDGTYTHSGILAIRAAVAAGVNITYKILYNDAVAMTGGQHAEGGYSVGEIAAQVAAERISRLVVVSDDPDKYPPNGYFPPGTSVFHRDRLDQAQRELRETEGVTVLIYDQTCAAEKRRRRKRGLYPDPPRRVFINDLVCEGCGDCQVKSNCVSVKPLETEFGRKRQIDQSNCNKDFSCLNGFCPSFVTVHGGALRKVKKSVAAAPADDDPFAGLPQPQVKELAEPYGVLITGIGGTGVITVGALLGMAAHIEGKGCTVLDFTGLSQKNGAVMSHVRLAPRPEDLAAVRIAPGGADLLLGCDMVVAASAPALTRVEHGVTRAVVNDYLQPTASFVINPDLDFEYARMKKAMRQALGESQVDFVKASELATALTGDAIATNLFMLGYAWQRGLLPLSLGAIEKAVELNGAAVEMNLRAFAWGRLAAHDPEKVQRIARPLLAPPPPEAPDLDQVVARRVAFLTGYQDAAWAERYRRLVEEVRAAEQAKTPGRSGLAEAVAHNLFRLMSYKDEYEVARLYVDPAFRARLERQFEGDYRLRFHLAPPLVARRDPETGELQKREFGAWMMPVFRVLARLKKLRGGPFDIFGYTRERRMERQLIADYEALVRHVIAGLTPASHAIAVDLLSVPEMIRGFGHVKERNVKAAKTKEAMLRAAFDNPPQLARAAE
ncbi:indolepyruvate ferredoxin oxidoreductase family protein [Camelimonas abortus]|uniref:Indolepyruvate ferredoxin oxidoreductase family protein n=1 Tax=Camelimonas abortus TaxID=1017184 RepID=A0ABV7LD73_9HYPH